jgi:hypothetical protein
MRIILVPSSGPSNTTLKKDELETFAGLTIQDF